MLRNVVWAFLFKTKDRYETEFTLNYCRICFVCLFSQILSAIKLIQQLSQFQNNHLYFFGGEPLIRFIEQSRCEIKKDKIKKKLKEMETDFQY